MLMTGFQLGQNIFPGITTTRSAYLPEVDVHHVLEVRSSGAELWAMKDWFASLEFFEDDKEGWVGGQSWFYLSAHHHLVKPNQPDHSATVTTE
jgi:hypothetical protein